MSKYNFKSELVNKKLLTQFVIVVCILSMPIIYLLFSNYDHFKENDKSNNFEINGVYKINFLLNELMELNQKNRNSISDNFKRIFLNINLIQNEFELDKTQLEELKRIIKLHSKSSREDLADEFLGPLIRFFANNSKLILDPDLDTYYLMDVLVLKSPLIYQLMARDSDFVTIERFLKQNLIVLTDIAYSIKQVRLQHLEINPKLESLDKCYASLETNIHSQLKNLKNFNTDKIVNDLYKCNKKNADLLLDFLKLRNSELEKKYLLTIRLTLFIWIFGVLLAFFIYFKVVNSESKILLKMLKQEKLLLENEKLSTLGELASSIVHEIKNPLMLIDIEAKYIAKTLDKENIKIEIVDKKLNKISEMSKRINKISTTITTYSRNSQQDPFEKINILKILEESIYITNLKAAKSNVKIEYNSSSIELMCRQHQIEQVLINLINNSIDAIEDFEEKWIKLTVEKVNHELKEWLRITIEDCGLGIAKENIDSIFTSFYTSKKAGKGTGLGLSVAQKIIESHQGKIFYDRESFHTKFIIELPL
jgi:signal transduction histidine kinase